MVRSRCRDRRKRETPSLTPFLTKLGTAPSVVVPTHGDGFNTSDGKKSESPEEAIPTPQLQLDEPFVPKKKKENKHKNRKKGGNVPEVIATTSSVDELDADDNRQSDLAGAAVSTPKKKSRGTKDGESTEASIAMTRDGNKSQRFSRDQLVMLVISTAWIVVAIGLWMVS